MKIPEDQTDPELIEKVKSLFGVTFTNHMGTELTAFDYLHGQVFHVRDKCPSPEFNGTVSSMFADSYVKFYEEYLNRNRVKKENNAQQFIIDNGIVAKYYQEKADHNDYPMIEFHALSGVHPPNDMNNIFNAMFKGKQIKVFAYEHSFIHTGTNIEISFKFNKSGGEMYWTLEKDPESECGYVSTSRDNEWSGVHCFNHRHMDEDKMDKMVLSGFDAIFDVIKAKHCTGNPVGVNRAGSAFILATGHVCRVVGGYKPVNPSDEFEISIEIGEMFSDTRFQKSYGTAAIPKVAKYITDDEFMKALREQFNKKAMPLYEFTKKTLGII